MYTMFTSASRCLQIHMGIIIIGLILLPVTGVWNSREERILFAVALTSISIQAHFPSMYGTYEIDAMAAAAIVNPFMIM